MALKKFEKTPVNFVRDLETTLKKQEEAADVGGIIDAGLVPVVEEVKDDFISGSVKQRLMSQKKETKSKRLNLLLTPSLYDQLKAASTNLDMSVNEYVNLALSEIVKKQQSEL